MIAADQQRSQRWLRRKREKAREKSQQRGCAAAVGRAACAESAESPRRRGAVRCPFDRATGTLSAGGRLCAGRPRGGPVLAALTSSAVLALARGGGGAAARRRGGRATLFAVRENGAGEGLGVRALGVAGASPPPYRPAPAMAAKLRADGARGRRQASSIRRTMRSPH